VETTLADPIFEKSRAISTSIEGMLSQFSMAAMDSLLAFQAERGTTGDMVELGVFRGKSAAIIAGRLTGGEKLHLYDVADQFDRDGLGKTGANLQFNIANTLELSHRQLREHRHAIRFCHIDASHMFEPTMHEMKLADYMLADNGVLCLDDYTNLHYSQIVAATFKYLFTTKTDLTMFMVTDAKAYLCRHKVFLAHAREVISTMIARMADRGENVCLARTDDTPAYGAVYMRPKEKGETADFYGLEIYRPYYEIRDHSLSGGRLKQLSRKVSRRLKSQVRSRA
jgi:hypothetical protein